MTYNLLHGKIVKIFDDTNGTLDYWSSMFIVDKHLPLKTLRVKHKQLPKLLTPDMIEAIKTRVRYKSLNDDIQYIEVGGIK